VTCAAALFYAWSYYHGGSVVRAQIAAIEKRLETQDALIASIGGGRSLAMVEVKNGSLSFGSEGVSFDPRTGTIAFPNPKRLMFVPVISHLDDNPPLRPYSTETHYIQQMEVPNKFTVRSKVLDTGERAGAGHGFTAVVIGFEPSSPK
jgi:hypothetical protein